MFVACRNSPVHDPQARFRAARESFLTAARQLARLLPASKGTPLTGEDCHPSLLHLASVTSTSPAPQPRPQQVVAGSSAATAGERQRRAKSRERERRGTCLDRRVCSSGSEYEQRGVVRERAGFGVEYRSGQQAGFRLSYIVVKNA